MGTFLIITSGAVVARRFANMAVQRQLGYYPSGGLGLVLLIVVVLALTGRV